MNDYELNQDELHTLSELNKHLGAIMRANEKIKLLQNSCPHNLVTKRYKQTREGYATMYKCQICSKTWAESDSVDD